MTTRSTKTPKTTATPKKAAAKKTTAKPAKATASKVAAKPAAAPKATVVETVKPKVAAAPVKKPELIERVMSETGMKKKDVKPVVEAMLHVLGRALVQGEELIVPPLGKVMVKNSKDLANATVMNIKVRQPNATNTPKEGLAEAAE